MKVDIAPAGDASREAGGPYCDQCGRPETAPDHPRCATRRELEPPRYCPTCTRRMIVQVDPVGWTARCSRHGTRRS